MSRPLYLQGRDLALCRPGSLAADIANQLKNYDFERFVFPFAVVRQLQFLLKKGFFFVG